MHFFLEVVLRYHGRWIFKKVAKKFFFAVQIEKTEKNGEKSFLLFTIKRIHRELSHVMRIAVEYFICAREPFSIWLFHRKSSFRSCQIFFMSGRKLYRKKTSCPFSSPKKPKRRKSGGTSKFSVEVVEQYLWLSDCGSHCFKLGRMVEGTLGHKSRQ